MLSPDREARLATPTVTDILASQLRVTTVFESDRISAPVRLSTHRYWLDRYGHHSAVSRRYSPNVETRKKSKRLVHFLHKEPAYHVRKGMAFDKSLPPMRSRAPSSNGLARPYVGQNTMEIPVRSVLPVRPQLYSGSGKVKCTGKSPTGRSFAEIDLSRTGTERIAEFRAAAPALVSS